MKAKRILSALLALVLAASLFPTVNASDRTGQRFTDVTPDKWYYEAVNALADAGIVNGVGNGKFEPNRPMTAGELATVLWNMMYGDWCKATELFNVFNNGYYANYKEDPNYPGPQFEKYATVKYADMLYGNPYSNLVPLSWDGHVALAIYGDSRINKGNNNVPIKATNLTQITGTGRNAGISTTNGSPSVMATPG